MTGYARATVSTPAGEIACELKSVNARGLDLRLRLAPGLDALEPELRRRTSSALSRGAVTLNLTMERGATSGEVVVNEAALQSVLTALQDLSFRIEAAPARLDGILAIKGVIEQREPGLSSEDEEALQGGVFDCLHKCLADLLDARAGEGARLRDVLHARIDEIAALAVALERHPARSREVILDRLRRQLDELRAAAPGVALPEERLAQEVLLLATKSDIREELDRLAAHIAAARALLDAGGAVGRKLDFLSQEFNREANTLCAKVNAVELTAIGLDLKAVIEQFREQVQNVE